MDFYGDRVLRVFYKLLDKNTSFVEQKIVFWMSILLKNQILLLNNIEKIPNRRYRQELFLKIDLGDIDLETVEQKTWEGLFYDLIAEEQQTQESIVSLLDAISRYKETVDVVIMKEVEN